MALWWLALLCCLVPAALAQSETCYANDPDPYVKYATKTAYEFVGEKNSNQHVIPNCEPVMMWSLVRPGARLPSASRVRELQNLDQFRQSIIFNYDNGQVNRVTNVRLCRTDLDNLRNWRWRHRDNLTPEDLTSQGYMDTQTLARGYKGRYPNLMTNDPNDYLFKFAKEPANQNSFLAYAEGIFGQQATAIQINKEHDETLLQPFKRCAMWSKDVANNNDTQQQVRIFTTKLDFKNMVMNISSRLGFSYAIANRDVDRMWEMCRLDKAWDLHDASPWCAAFTKDDLKRLEYVEDLKTYYGSGYGSPLNAKLGCAPLKDMFQFFNKYINNPSMPPQPKSVVLFSPSAMLLMTLSALGAFQDTVPLTGDNYHTPLMQNRLWQTSNMDPFGANLVAVLYRCRDAGDQHRVMFFLNERPVLLNGCAVGLCDWTWVRNRLGHLAEKCDVKGFCQNKSNVTSVSLLALVSTLLALVRLS